MLSSHEIFEHIAFITAALEGLASGNEDLSRCLEIRDRLESLRDQYRQAPDTLTDQVPQLTRLSQRFDEVLDQLGPRAVDRFCEINQQMSLIEQEKGFWRQVLIRQASAQGRESLEGGEAIVRVRTLSGRALPTAGTPERERLETLVRKAGVWEEASQLSRTLLDRALKGRSIAAADVDAIASLFPECVTHQVSVRTSPDQAG